MIKPSNFQRLELSIPVQRQQSASSSTLATDPRSGDRLWSQKFCQI